MTLRINACSVVGASLATPMPGLPASPCRSAYAGVVCDAPTKAAGALLARGRAILVWAVMVATSGIAILATPVMAAPAAVAPADDLWSVKVPEFRADAAVAGAPTVLYFTATWCGYCRQMERTTLSNAGVRARLEPFTRIKLDFDQQPDWVARYRISGVPAFVMVDARGEEISRLVGATEPDPFRGWLEEARTRAVELAKAAAGRQLELKQLAAALAAEGPDVWEKTKTRVFELAARGEAESRAFALKQLTVRAEAAPATLRDGLLNPDLAVRLVVAGVLRKKLGERFVFDPWADAAARTRAIGAMPELVSP